jgi:hypothetical protein
MKCYVYDCFEQAIVKEVIIREGDEQVVFYCCEKHRISEELARTVKRVDVYRI